jgi:hypothetical protein
VTQLASAGVRALYAVSEQLTAHGQDLTLITAPGSAAHVVLDLVQLAPVAGAARRLGASRTRSVRHNL